MLKALSDKGFWHFEFSQNHTKNRQNLTAKRTVRAKNPFGVRLQKMQKRLRKQRKTLENTGFSRAMAQEEGFEPPWALTP